MFLTVDESSRRCHVLDMSLLFWAKHCLITMADVPKDASAAVLQPSEPVPIDAISVQGPNFDNPFSLHAFLATYERVGFQATSLGKAIDIVNRMVSDARSIVNNSLLRSIREDGGYPMNR